MRQEADEYKLALSLQAQGPDEYPFGYYLDMARTIARAQRESTYPPYDD